MSNTEFFWGTGRRKTAVARVRLMKGTGKFLVNGQEAEKFFFQPSQKENAFAPLHITNNVNKYDIYVNVQGGGVTGQAEAVLLGIARALIKETPALEAKLRSHGYLTRDSRMVERKKFGCKKARRSFQWVKR